LSIDNSQAVNAPEKCSDRLNEKNPFPEIRFAISGDHFYDTFDSRDGARPFLGAFAEGDLQLPPWPIYFLSGMSPNISHVRRQAQIGILRCLRAGSSGSLQAVQKIRRPLGVRCGSEERAFVVLQDLDPRRDIGDVMRCIVSVRTSGLP